MTTRQAILCLNAGSSSLKFALYQSDDLTLIAQGKVTRLYDVPQLFTELFPPRKPSIKAHTQLKNSTQYPPLEQAINALHFWLKECLVQLDQLDPPHTTTLSAIAHRVVHGNNLPNPTVITPQVLKQLEAIIPLAPLHLPSNLAVITAFIGLYPNAQHHACFDTAFHASQPLIAQQFALPNKLLKQGIKRYGFHGLSHQYVSQQLIHYDGTYRTKKMIIAHLGNGASLCGISHAQSQYCTMGFSTLDGLTMGTRCGALDPGVILYLLQQGYSQSELQDLLYHQSGLLGLSGLSGDMSDLIKCDSLAAKQAIEHFIYHAVREIGAITATLQGIDALVFTGGIGENAASIRQSICEQLSYQGLTIDTQLNNTSQCDQKLSVSHSTIEVWRINTDEEKVMAQLSLANVTNTL